MRALRLLSVLCLLITALPAQPQDRPEAAPVKPYQAVAIELPKPVNDVTFDILRQQLSEIADRKDRAALSRLVVTLGFFWDRENGNGADPGKSAIDNLAAALGLDSPDGTGWDMLATFADEPTASPSLDHKGAICSPADPLYDEKALDALMAETDTDISDWGYPISPNVEVYAAGEIGAAVVDKLGLYFVRVIPDAVTGSASFIHIAMPSGKTGYVSIDVIAPVGNDQLCYVPAVHGGWKIAGYIGGGEP